MSMTNVVAASLIASGAALVGAMSGWELGPYRFEFSRDQFALVGAFTCGALALAACSLAVERSEARARSKTALRRLRGALFRSREVSDTSPRTPASPPGDIQVNPAKRRRAGGSTRLTISGARP